MEVSKTFFCKSANTIQTNNKPTNTILLQLDKLPQTAFLELTALNLFSMSLTFGFKSPPTAGLQTHYGHAELALT